MACTMDVTIEDLVNFFPRLSPFIALFSAAPFYLHTVRVVRWEHGRPIQIEYLRETKHASDTLLRALLFRKFVFTRTRISVRKRPSWKRDKIAGFS